MIFFDTGGLAQALAGCAAAKRDLEHHRWLMSLSDEPMTLARPDGSSYRTSLRDFMFERDMKWRREKKAEAERAEERRVREREAAALESYSRALERDAALRERESLRGLMR